MAKTKKFDEKTYRGDRITEAPSGCVQIVRIWVWSKAELRYLAPERGARYEGIRYEPTPTGGKARRKASFDDLQAAREWQQHATKPQKSVEDLSGQAPGTQVGESSTSPTLAEVVADFRTRKYSRKAIGTREHYDQR